MRATTDAITSTPAYGDGRLYVQAASGAIALDAAGVDHCSSGTCTALWTYLGASGGSGLAVGHARLVTNQGGVARVFDAAGQLGCSGAPRTCGALWTSMPPTSTAGVVDDPVLTPNLVIAVRATTGGAEVAAYDLRTGPTCSGTPVVCGPRWTVPVPQQPMALIAGDNVGLVGAAPGGGVAPLVAFRLDGDGCNATTRACPPIATIPMTIAGGPTAVAGGRVLITGVGTPTRVFAVPA